VLYVSGGNTQVFNTVSCSMNSDACVYT